MFSLSLAFLFKPHLSLEKRCCIKTAETEVTETEKMNFQHVSVGESWLCKQTCWNGMAVTLLFQEN